MSYLFLESYNLVTMAIAFRDIQYFLLGMLTGVIILALSIAGILTAGERKKSRQRVTTGVALQDQVIIEMIKAKQDQLDQTVKLTDNGYFKVALDLSFELSEEIARHYFPEKRYPLYELSIEEILDLNRYITKRIDELMSSKILRRFKKYRIASLISMLNTKKKISDSKLMQLSRKMKIQAIYTGAKTVINYANPIFWFRKLAIKPTTVLVTKEASKFIIQIFGEETNKIYSKVIFKAEDDVQRLSTEMDEMLEGEEGNVQSQEEA